MYGSFITVLVKGIYDAGGLEAVWQRNLDSSRVEFLKYTKQIVLVSFKSFLRYCFVIYSVDFDPTTRHTVKHSFSYWIMAFLNLVIFREDLVFDNWRLLLLDILLWNRPIHRPALLSHANLTQSANVK